MTDPRDLLAKARDAVDDLIHVSVDQWSKDVYRLLNEYEALLECERMLREVAPGLPPAQQDMVRLRLARLDAARKEAT